ncbi:MAG: hypothetical protein HFH68_12210 [Lachnospiraceae bacterium]|nr:hypothetical protein [Lachnospiraceae bacterium]
MPDTGTPYDDVFRTMTTDCPFLLIPLINEVFGEHYTGNEKITLLQNEHFIKLADGKLKKRVTDSSISLPGSNSRIYHFECQSTPDGEIIIRIFEYASQMALEGAYASNGKLVLEYPHSAILYLRHNSNTPDNMEITIKTPGGEVSYKVPVIKMDYSLEEIFRKNLLFLIPFYIFCYEKEFPAMENGSGNLVKAEQEFLKIVNVLDSMCLNGEITEYIKCMLSGMSKIVIDNIAAKYEKVKEGLGGIMGGKVLEYEAKTILKTGIEQGMERALVFMVVKKIKKGKGIEIIAEELEEDKEKIGKIFYAAMEAAPGYDIDKICDTLNQ